MIILITGASHTGKTALAQRLLEKYHYPYLSIDHLKMGLIRSGNTELTPMDDDKLTEYLWPIVREMVKTAIENKQNLIVEGCYIPFDWEKDFAQEYREEIRYYCLVMSEEYIRKHFDDIKGYACVIEDRLDDTDCTLESVLEDNAWYREQAEKYGVNCVWIEDEYEKEIEVMDQTWIFRKAVKEDKEKIKDLFLHMLRSIYHKEDVDGYEEGYLDKFFTDSGDWICVVEDKGTVVAYLSMEVHREELNYIYLDDLSVMGEYQSKGIGTRLIGIAEKYARDIDFPMVVLHVEKSNEGAYRLYRRLGYEVEKEEGSRYLMVKKG